MTRMSEIERRLAELETARARQDTTTAPSCVFLPSNDFDNKEARQAEEQRLKGLYGDRTIVILCDIVNAAGVPVWKHDPKPSTEEILASPEYRKVEQQYYDALAGPDPDKVLQAMSDSTLLLLEAGVIERGPPEDPEALALYNKAKAISDRNESRNTPPDENDQQTPIAPLQTHEDKPGDKFTNVNPVIARGTFEQNPPARPLPALDVYSGGRLRMDEDEQPDPGRWKAADYSKEYRRRMGDR
jgi:hypothetical protein